MTQVTSLITNVITANLIATVGWRSISAIYGTVACVMCVLCFLGVREHVDAGDDGEVKADNVPLSKALPALLKNKYFYIQALMFMFLYINVVATGSMTYYFCNSVLGNIAFLSWTTVAGTVPGAEIPPALSVADENQKESEPKTVQDDFVPPDINIGGDENNETKEDDFAFPDEENISYNDENADKEA